MRDALPRDFARINLLQCFARAGFGDETVFFAHEIELKQSGEVETRERGRAASFPLTRARITPSERDGRHGSKAIVKVA